MLWSTMLLTISFLSSSFIIFICFLLTLTSSFLFLTPNSIILISWNLFLNITSNIKFQLIFDSNRLLFSSTVFFISINVLIFANSYIKSDYNKKRFLLLVILFIISINILIFIPHLIFLLLGWDGLGLVSFLLIIHYQTPNALSSGFITVLINRIGDVIILVSLILIFNCINWFPTQSFNNPSNLLIIFIIIAGITKRAQIPFSSWLPAAIAAPTPVSALVHSSTLVTAGVFLLLRFWPILSQSTLFPKILSILASITIIIARIRAITEFDIKKIIALSTLSQLGLIITSLSLGQTNLTFFHLLTHAIFKALLFICAGNLILQFSHSQDLRQFGNNLVNLPITTAAIIISKIALCGIPFIAGFYSKDIIIEFTFQSNFNLLITIIILLGLMTTIIYSIRFIIFIIATPSFHSSSHSTTNLDSNLNLPITIITLYVIPWGRWLNWTIIQPCINTNFSDLFKTIIPIIIIISFLFSSLLIFPPLSKTINNKIFFFSSSIWLITPLLSQFLIKWSYKTPNVIYKHLDRGWLEIISSEGLKYSISNFRKSYISWQINITSIYIMPIFLLLLFIFIL